MRHEEPTARTTAPRATLRRVAATPPPAVHGDAMASTVRSFRAPPRTAMPALARVVSERGSPAGAELMRSAVVGLPGANNPKTTYAAVPADVNLLAAAAANALPPNVAAWPGWFANWLQPHLQTLVSSPIAYTFDTTLDAVHWILVRELMVEIGRYTNTANPPGAQARTGRGRSMRADLRLLEPLRNAYDLAGAANQNFPFCGRTYALVNSGLGHHYASRAGTTIVYSEDFTRGDARAVLQHLRNHGSGAAYTGPDKDVDNFVCAFLAEPSRWRVEHVFNVLALNVGDDNDPIVGTAVHALPMAGGSTWEPGANGGPGSIAHGLPRRALQFAQSTGLIAVIDQEIGATGDFAALALAVRRQLDITQ
ncbi:MAG TPA: hypothetical protein VNT54_02095 [Solirubrobacteraceae bacterium]|nr:hypothetical protein [Solirubrobacteraceae bacterium]